MAADEHGSCSSTTLLVRRTHRSAPKQPLPLYSFSRTFRHVGASPILQKFVYFLWSTCTQAGILVLGKGRKENRVQQARHLTHHRGNGAKLGGTSIFAPWGVRERRFQEWWRFDIPNQFIVQRGSQNEHRNEQGGSERSDRQAAVVGSHGRA